MPVYAPTPATTRRCWYAKKSCASTTPSRSARAPPFAPCVRRLSKSYSRPNCGFVLVDAPPYVFDSAPSMKVALLVLVFLGAASGCTNGPLNGHPEDSEGQWLDGWRALTNVHLFNDDSCSTETSWRGGSPAKSSSEWATSSSTNMTYECTPQHGECFVITAACQAKGDFCPALGSTPKAMKIWYADQGGLPASINYAAVAGGVGGSFLLVIIMWLANCFGKPSCGEPSWMLCPSPLPMFKPKPSEPKASSGASSSV